MNQGGPRWVLLNENNTGKPECTNNDGLMPTEDYILLWWCHPSWPLRTVPEGGYTIGHHSPRWRWRFIVRGKDNLEDYVKSNHFLNNTNTCYIEYTYQTCTELFKVTTWQGKLVIKPPKNITNKLFYYLYFILSYSHNTSKDDYFKNTVGDKVSIPSKPCPSRDEET